VAAVLPLLANAKTELGQGIVDIDIYTTREINIYKSWGDSKPEKVIRLVNNKDYISIAGTDYKHWLQPESIWLDYSSLLFRYTKIEGNWIEVIVHNETGEKRWIQKIPTLKILQWKDFLVTHTTGIEPHESVDIKTEASSTSATIRKYTKQDCFEAVEVKGDWIKIRTNRKLECNEHLQPIEAGWIRWRHNGQLVIVYYLTC